MADQIDLATCKLTHFQVSPLIKRVKSKKELSDEISSMVDDFIRQGNDVKEIPKGVSSRDEATSPLRPEKWQMEKSTGERTYVPEVIDALEKRKKATSPAPQPTTRKKTPRKKLIYDDFGEPLRWVWVDE